MPQGKQSQTNGLLEGMPGCYVNSVRPFQVRYTKSGYTELVVALGIAKSLKPCQPSRGFSALSMTNSHWSPGCG